MSLQTIKRTVEEKLRIAHGHEFNLLNEAYYHILCAERALSSLDVAIVQQPHTPRRRGGRRGGGGSASASNAEKPRTDTRPRDVTITDITDALESTPMYLPS